MNTTHYVELTVRENPELACAHILSMLVERIHLAIVRFGAGEIGLSFPDYSAKANTLGRRVRIFGDETAMDLFAEGQWLRGVQDHVLIGPARPVPDGCSYRTVARKQFKTGLPRLRRRWMKRHDKTAAEAAAAYPDSVQQTPDVPYVWLASASTGQRFALFVSMGPITDSPASGGFTAYGLSKGGSVPWF